MKFFLSIIIISFYTITFCKAQTITFSDSLKLEVVKSKVISKTFNVRSGTKLKSNQMKKIQVKLKMESLDKDSIDINAFSLIDKKNKLRYRLIEFSGYKTFSIANSGITGKRYLKTEYVNKKGKPYKDLPEYNPSITDSFYDYNFEGFENVEIPTTFIINKGGWSGALALLNKKLELSSIVYYGHTKLNKFTADLIFAALIDENNSLELYYGSELVEKLKL